MGGAAMPSDICSARSSRRYARPETTGANAMTPSTSRRSRAARTASAGPQAHAEHEDALDSRSCAQSVDGITNARHPLCQASGIAVAASRVARSVVVEPQRRDADRADGLGEVAKASVGADGFVTERIADDEARARVA